MAEQMVLPLPENDDENYARSNLRIMSDSYSNYQARLGMGQPNLTETGFYPICRLTEDYPLILSLYRSSWIVRKIIDSVSTDMFKAFPVLDSDLQSEQVRLFNKVIGSTRTIPRLRSACKWGRLFGGAGAIIVLDGHNDLKQPLELDDVDIGSYKGLIPLDRWSGILAGPEINNDISDPDGFGLPTYYNCVMDAGNVKIHHSRILRFAGRELPQWEVQTELYWGMSEVEVIFDELRKRDYSSWNIISLLSRAQILSISEPQLAAMMSGANATQKTYYDFVQRMQSISEQMNNQGLLILGKDGKLEQKSYSFGGMSQIYHEFMKDLAAATGIPYEILFGREGGGGESGEGGNAYTALQLYDNFIDEKRISEANPVIDKLLPILCMSTFGEVPDDLAYHWNPIRAISDKERSDLGKSLVESILMGYNADLLTKKEARKELSLQSGTNGLFSSVTEESIAETPDIYASEIYMQAQMMTGDPNAIPSRQEEMASASGEEAQAQAQGKAQEPGEAKVLNKPPAQTSGLGTSPATSHKPVSGSQESASGKGPMGSPPTKHGYREGEFIPISAKPVGVKSLLWHREKRIANPKMQPPSLGSGGKVGGVGGQASGTQKSLEQGLEHSQKHVMKAKEPKTKSKTRNLLFKGRK